MYLGALAIKITEIRDKEATYLRDLWEDKSWVMLTMIKNRNRNFLLNSV